MPDSLRTIEPTRVILAKGDQRVLFTQHDGSYHLTTEVKVGGRWQPFFDLERPLLLGSQLDLRLTRYTMEGKRRLVFNDGLLTVEADASTPLLHFTLRYPLPAPLTLNTPQPTVALWRRETPTAFHLDQGPESIYGSAGIPHNFGFPAAYLWDEGSEAAVFFAMTPMRWMQPDGVARFYDVRIQAKSDSGRVGLGLHTHKLTGKTIPAGELVVSFALYQAPCPKPPTGLEALATLVRIFAPLHPQTSTPPSHHWETLAQQTLAELVTPQTLATLTAPWQDAPLALVPAQTAMLVHPAQVQPAGSTGELPWDFSTVNNHLTPWLLLARLHANTGQLKQGLQKVNALPRFYDPKAQLLRHGTLQPPHVGDKEMSWQNFFFSVETSRAAAAVPTEHFNPAVLGRFLMGLRGLQALAQKSDYAFPQWFDPDTKTALTQNDVPVLGVVREPWQGGTYALLQLHGHTITGDKTYLTEAQRALETLFEHLSFRVKNALYDRTYSDPATFPLTELFGNAYGTLAAYQLYVQTRNPKHRRYAHDFLHTLLRLTFWYEDETTPISRELKSAGLFYPHGAAHVATPWETVEAHLAIAGVLRQDPKHPLTELLLRLSNLNRVNAFDFFPACWSERVRAHDPRPRPAGERHFPIEPFYSLEGTGGHQGPTAAYMASLSLWNHWLYDALAEADDPAVLVLNLASFEGYEEALMGVERQLLVYNPGPRQRTIHLHHKHLPEGCGWPERQTLTLASGQHQRVVLRRPDRGVQQRQLAQRRSAQGALAYAYQRLQERGHSEFTGRFSEALTIYHAGQFADALRLIRPLLSR